MTKNASTNPVVLVTGSAKRVGREIIKHFAANGYRAAVHANHSMEEAEQLVRDLREQGIESQAFQADLTIEDDIERLFDEVYFYFGRLDVLVNSASVFDRIPLEEMDASRIAKEFQINTFAVMLCCRCASVLMAGQSSGGAVINIGDWSKSRPAKDFAAYIASKGAIETITRSMAVELAMRNPKIRVNAILPGQVLLPEGTSDERRQAAIDATLVKRLGAPEDVAQAALFLATSGFVTGVCLPVDGGRSVFSGQFEDASVHG